MSILHVMTDEQRHVLAPHVERQAEAYQKAAEAQAAAKAAEQALLRAVSVLLPADAPADWTYNPVTGVVSVQEGE